MAKPSKLTAGQVVVTIGKAFHIDVPGGRKPYAVGETPTVDAETAAVWKAQGLLAPDTPADSSGGK